MRQLRESRIRKKKSMKTEHKKQLFLNKKKVKTDFHHITPT